MSCYEWERGTIVLPAKEWAGFRKKLLTLWNEKQDELYETAKKAHLAAQAAAKGKRGKNRQPPILREIAKVCGGEVDTHGNFSCRRDDSDVFEMWERVTGLILCGKPWKVEATNTKNPQKKYLKKFPISKSASIRIPDGEITFNNENRTVTWDVDENNHAKDHARGHWFARALFRALDGVDWTSKTGGVIVGNDEYNRDADYPGGGGNYITSAYGGIGKREQKRVRGF